MKAITSSPIIVLGIVFRLLAGFCPAWGEEPVQFADATLKAAVEDALWVLDPTPADMLGLTSLSCNSYWGQNGSIRDLTGLESAVNLQSLSLQCHEFSSLLSLSGMINLEHLDLRECPVSDISPLSGMHRLSWLSLHKTRVSDISPLVGLPALSYVDLRGTPLNLDAYEIHIPQLRAERPGITIWCDPYRERPHTVTITSSSGGSVVCPGEGPFLYEQGQTACLKAQPRPGFVLAGWSGADDSEQNPLCFSVTQDQEIRANFVSLSSELYVDDDAAGDPGPNDSTGSDPDEAGTAERPFDSIQEAIEVAMDGATIIVGPGTYREHVDLLGKKIHLAAIDPADPHGGPCATIDGTNNGRVVTIPQQSGRECSLSGFIITAGKGPIAGGICCLGSSPTLSNCLVVGNRCTDPNGAAAYFSHSQAVLANCTVADNYGGTDGAALTLVDSRIVMIDSIVWGNHLRGVVSRGASDPSIRFCCVQNGWLDAGNIQIDPLFARRGFWACRTDPNLMLPPQDRFSIWVSGDYHLKSQAGRWDSAASLWLADEVTSPCIDAGDPGGGAGHEPPPNGSVINMGAYGGTAQASKSCVIDPEAGAHTHGEQHRPGVASVFAPIRTR